MLYSFPCGKWNLFTNTQYKDVNTGHPDFVLSSADNLNWQFHQWLYSTIHKAEGSLVTGRSQKSNQQEQPPWAIPHWQLQRWKGGMME